MRYATYSPEDDKLRLYTTTKLPKDEYERVKKAGFIWAPKQELFVAVWTPDREDLALELFETIEDEDKSLVERQEERAERFEEYSEKRAADAERAHAAVEAIASAIPLGQPILVGHHSERHARKHAEKIENGMRRAIHAFKTSEYWKDRAAGALRHAKYKELPAVRFRRIKTLEASERKHKKERDKAVAGLKAWTDPTLTHETALRIAGRSEAGYLRLPRKEGDREDWDYTPTAYDALTNGHPTLYAPRTLEEIVAAAPGFYNPTIEWRERWLAHLGNRLAYERAMLGDSGGIAAEKFDLKPGGQVLIAGEWVTIIRVTRKDGAVKSVTTNARYVRVRGVEEIKDYRPPAEGMAEKVKAATALPPLCNYPAVNHHEITNAEWKRTYKDYKGTKVIEATPTTATHRVRSMVKGGCSLVYVFIKDAPRKDPPAFNGKSPPPPASVELPWSVDVNSIRPKYEPPAETKFDALEEVLKAGVKVVTSPSLYPTPPAIARQVVELAAPEKDDRILEPSAGTGALLRALGPLGKYDVAAVERNHALATELSHTWATTLRVVCGDFLAEIPGSLGTLGEFDRIIMNPPFDKGADIKHVQHALKFLRAGGRLVAIVAAGPRQKEAFDDGRNQWIPLPADTFKDAGTSVNTAIVVIDHEIPF